MSEETRKPQDEEAFVDDHAVLQASRRHTRRSFVAAGVAVAAGYGFYRWVGDTHSLEMQPAPLRRALQTDAALSRLVFNNRALAPTYPLRRAQTLRVNGVVGLDLDIVSASWRLQMVGVAGAENLPQYVPDVTAWEYQYMHAPAGQDAGHDTKVKPSEDTAEKMSPKSMVAKEMLIEQRAGMLHRGLGEAGESYSTFPAKTPGLLLAMDDITKLPKRELVTQFKCIEGWSEIVRWGGYRMADLIAAFPPARKPDGTLPRYVYMETPNGDYYVGYDLHDCLQPQTLLVTEMSGQPLEQPHGAPLRLHTPAKYGYKQIKRIGLLAYTDTKPDDYWTELGYDWYAGL